MDQPRLARLLRLIHLLIGNRKTTSELSDILNCNIRTIQRYIDTLNSVGIVVEFRQKGIPYLSTNSGLLKEISDLVHFSEEEAIILHKAIDSIIANNSLKQNLKKKLYSIYNFPWLAEVIIKPEIGENVELLTSAIQQELCVELINYRSAHSNKISNRIVEPYDFTTNYEQVWCYEHQSNMCKLFNVARIGKVKILEKSWENISKHEKRIIDVFRNSSTEYVGKIDLILNVRSYNLLIEEYPLAEKYITPIDYHTYRLITPICSYEGPIRFTLGLLDNIIIKGDNIFLQLLKNKISGLRKLIK